MGKSLGLRGRRVKEKMFCPNQETNAGSNVAQPSEQIPYEMKTTNEFTSRRGNTL
jgi:hypothetical protein